jgi:hypothetical protein
MFVYDAPDHKEHVALILGALDGGGPVLVRAHSECLTGDVFGSSRCDCGEQLDESLRFLQEQGRGVLQGRPQSERAQQLRQASLQQLVIGGLGEYFDPFTGKLLGRILSALLRSSSRPATPKRLWRQPNHLSYQGERRRPSSASKRSTSRRCSSSSCRSRSRSPRRTMMLPTSSACCGISPEAI